MNDSEKCRYYLHLKYHGQRPMETSLAFSGVGLLVGWISRAYYQDIPHPCQCNCHFGCACESSLSTGSLLIIFVFGTAVVVLLFLAVSSKDLLTVTSDSSRKGSKGVYGSTGKVLTITG